MADSLKRKIKGLTEESCKSEQRPYFNTAMKEFKEVKAKYKEWLKKIPTNTGLLFGYTDIFPYPSVMIKFSFLDLAEKKIEELW